MIRFIHLVVACSFVAAAAYVYKIKFDSTVQGERVAKIRAEIQRERDETARLRAEWGRLDNPARIQALAQRHLALRLIDPTQFDALDKLPDRPTPIVPPDAGDPIAAIIDKSADLDPPTGSVPEAKP